MLTFVILLLLFCNWPILLLSMALTAFCLMATETVRQPVAIVIVSFITGVALTCAFIKYGPQVKFFSGGMCGGYSANP